MPTISTLIFDLGDTQKCVFIPVVDDGVLDGTETILVTAFSSSSGGVVVANRNVANVFVTDNEGKNPAAGVITQIIVTYMHSNMCWSRLALIDTRVNSLVSRLSLLRVSRMASNPPSICHSAIIYPFLSLPYEITSSGVGRV